VLDSAPAAPGILLTALHGQALGDVDGTVGHARFVESGQVRVPLLWRSPRAGGGTTVGRRITKPVSLLDVAPTLLESAGFPAPASFEGSVLPHSDPAVPELDTRVVFAETADAVAVIRGREFALLPRALAAVSERSANAPPEELWLRLSDPVQPFEPAPTAGPPTLAVPMTAQGDGTLDLPDLRSEVTRLPLDWRGNAAIKEPR
jgi:hypothetical protein